mmetsp:Transcript_24625/g.61513  ORF Transcript_24625/g.61513 Transcript_24625/m.61513 type:complete len:152 (+) Transcript_24625:210-665(+)
MYPGASSMLQPPTPSNPRPAAGLRPCPFPSCAKQFTHQFQLTAHLRTHTGECPYPCPASGCDKAFKWRSSLAHHTRLHTLKSQSLLPPMLSSRKMVAGTLSRTKSREIARVLPGEAGMCWAEQFLRDSESLVGDVGEVDKAAFYVIGRVWR